MRDNSQSNPLDDWRQGDYSLGVGPFLYGDLPDQGSPDTISVFFDDESAEGMVVISQTCDVVSDPKKFEYVAVCPLVRVDKNRISEIARGRAPRFGFVELAPTELVADFARPMTVSKQLLVSWKRCDGFSNPKKALEFSRGLERAFGRFAFPDAFNESIRPLVKKIVSKYGKPESALGKALNSLAELRVRPSDEWDTDNVRVQFFLIFESEEKRSVSPSLILEQFENEIKELPWQGGFSLDDPPIRIGNYDDFLARDYIESVPLDVNALSFAARYLQSQPQQSTDQGL